jgi:hypothetical protein
MAYITWNQVLISETYTWNNYQSNIAVEWSLPLLRIREVPGSVPKGDYQDSILTKSEVISTLKMEVACPSENMVTTYHTARHQTPEDRSFKIYRRENLGISEMTSIVNPETR